MKVSTEQAYSLGHQMQQLGVVKTPYEREELCAAWWEGFHHSKNNRRAVRIETERGYVKPYREKKDDLPNDAGSREMRAD